MAAITLALAGDTMLGRGVGQRLASGAEPSALFDPRLVELTRSADLFILNLECCISNGGEPWPNPRKPFFFRAPPIAVEALRHLGVDLVTLANNHALDYGAEALADTLAVLAAADIASVGAGNDVAKAREAVVLQAHGYRLGVVGVTDHPAEFAAGDRRPGVAFADLSDGVPEWLTQLVHYTGRHVDGLLVTPHWGPNMTPSPVPQVRRALNVLREAGASLVAGHSAHVVHGVARDAIYDLGDFIDDYAVDPVLRNDLGLLFIAELADADVTRLEAVPIALDYAHTRLATDAEADLVTRRFTAACAEFRTEVERSGNRLVVSWPGVQEPTFSPAR